jgi:hypothetical protein
MQEAAAGALAGQTRVKALCTASGIKDMFQDFFLNKLTSISKKRGLSKEQKLQQMYNMRLNFPKTITSPVWHIRGQICVSILFILTN